MDNDIMIGKITQLTQQSNPFVVTHVSNDTSNLILRRLLWLRHGCPSSALYGDDGEMRCNKCGIDFLRTPASKIEEIFNHIGVEHLSTHTIDTQQEHKTQELLGVSISAIPILEKYMSLNFEQHVAQQDDEILRAFERIYQNTTVKSTLCRLKDAIEAFGVNVAQITATLQPYEKGKK